MAWPDEMSPFPVEKGSEEKKTPINHEEGWDFLHP